MKALRSYMVSPSEFGVMLEVLKLAADGNLLTPAQLGRLCGDPYDIVRDLEGETVQGVVVLLQAEREQCPPIR